MILKYKCFPERLLVELQQSVRKKIQSSKDFELTDKEILTTRKFLQDTILHIENICDCESSLLSVLDFYMRIGAKIPKSTVKYIENNTRASGMKQRLAAYSGVVERPMITLQRSGAELGEKSSMGVFSSVNIDRGTRRKILYSDCFNNLIRNINAWIDDDSTCFIRDDQEYDVLVDDCKIALIDKNKTLVVIDSCEVDGFIEKQFGKPLWVKLAIKTELIKGKCNFYWVCSDLYGGATGISCSGFSGLFLPALTSLRSEIVKDEVSVLTSSAVQEIKRIHNITSDIFVAVSLDGVDLGVLDKKSGSLRFNRNSLDTVLNSVGVVERPSVEFYYKDEYPMDSFFKKICNALRFK